MKIEVNAKAAQITERETLTVGSKGIMIAVSFSPEWDGLTKTALFWDGTENEAIPVLIFSDFILLPPEMTATKALKPLVTFVGKNAEGTVVFPAVECPLGTVWYGIRGGKYPIEPPTSDWIAQIEAGVAEANRKAQEALDTVTDNLPLTERAEAAAKAAEESAKNSGQSAEASATSAASSAMSARRADESAQSASGSATAAKAAQSAAAGSASGSAESAQQAKGYEDEARRQAVASAGSASAAQKSAAAAKGSENTVKADADRASTAAGKAEQSEQNAQAAAAAAKGSEGSALASQQAAETAASDASASATTAGQKATAAARSAEQAQTDTLTASEASKTATAQSQTATTEANRSKAEADRAKSEAERAAEVLAAAPTKTDTANALTRTVQGEVIALDDVSPLEHSVGCKVGRINIANTEWIKTEGGFTFIANEANPRTAPLLPDGVYVLSFEYNDTASAEYWWYDVNGGYRFLGYMKQGVNVKAFTVKAPAVNRFGFRSEKISNIQISKGPDEYPFTPYIPDLSKVTVSRFAIPMISGIGYDIAGSQVKVSGAVSTLEIPTNGSDKVTIGGLTRITLAPNLTAFAIFLTSDDTVADFWPLEFPSRTLKLPENVEKIKFSFSQVDASTLYVEFSNGRRINGNNYDPSPDGIVSGMTSLSPNMTVLTDTPGALLDISYNQDSMAVIKKLSDRITELENNVVNSLT